MCTKWPVSSTVNKVRDAQQRIDQLPANCQRGIFGYHFTIAVQYKIWRKKIDSKNKKSWSAAKDEHFIGPADLSHITFFKSNKWHTFLESQSQVEVNDDDDNDNDDDDDNNNNNNSSDDNKIFF